MFSKFSVKKTISRPNLSRLLSLNPAPSIPAPRPLYPRFPPPAPPIPHPLPLIPPPLSPYPAPLSTPSCRDCTFAQAYRHIRLCRDCTFAQAYLSLCFIIIIMCLMCLCKIVFRKSQNTLKKYFWILTLSLLVLSADDLCEQFGPRSDPIELQACSGSKLLHTLMVFPKYFLKKVDFAK